MTFRRSQEKRKHHGQGLVEFALTIFIFLILVIGLFEVARLVFLYSSVFTASRDAARYAAGSEHYSDCEDIRNRAVTMGTLANLEESDIEIWYDKGPDANGNAVIVDGDCPLGTELEMGDRVVVRVTGSFVPLFNFLPLEEIDIKSTSARSVVTGLRICYNEVDCGD